MNENTQIIDYRWTGWGHNHTLKQDVDGRLRGFCWYGHRVGEGDRIVWKTVYGQAVGEVKSVKWMIDPNDMYEIEVEVIERYMNEEVLS